MLNEGRVQSTDIAASDGLIAPPRMGKSLATMTQDAHGRYQDAVRRGNVYIAALTAITALSVNSTTFTGLALANPVGSGKNLVLLNLMAVLGVALPTTAVQLILTGGAQAAAITTNLVTIRNAFIGGGGTGVGVASSGATIQTASLMRWLYGSLPATSGTQATPTFAPPFLKDEIAGEIILAPGQLISLQALTTLTSVGAQLSWEEIPI
jgi:hypothetical protein